MKITTEKMVVEPEFVPFSVTFTFNTEAEVEKALESLKNNLATGNHPVGRVIDIPSMVHDTAKIYYAIKCRGN